MSEDYYVGWRLNRTERDALLRDIPPKYSRVNADHVTFAAPVSESAPLPKPVAASVVGIVDDGGGMQVLIVTIDGSTARPDGSTYHITWSMAEDRKSVESNAVIKALGWKTLPPRPIQVEPMMGRISSK